MFDLFSRAPNRYLSRFRFIVVSLLLLSLSACMTTPQTSAQDDDDAISSAIASSSSRPYGSSLSPKDRKAAEAYVSYIVKHYKISKKGARRIVEAVIAESKTHKVDRSLITAVIAVESRFHPYAVSKSNAEGLMQVIPRWHPEKMAKIGGEEQIVDTRRNIAAGTLTLKEYLRKHNQDVVLALQQYNGSLNDPRRRYSKKVLAEKSRIDRWVMAKAGP